MKKENDIAKIKRENTIANIADNGEIEYTPHGEFLKNLSFLRQNKIKPIIDVENYVVNSPLYLLPVSHNDKAIGFINKQAEIVIQAEYSRYGGYFVDESSIITVERDNLWGAINSKGDTIVPFEYQLLYPPTCDLMLARSNGRFGYIDIKNNVVASFSYEWADIQFVKEYRTDIGYARVIQNGKWGIINTKGETVAPIKYDRIWQLKRKYLHSVHAEIGGEVHTIVLEHNPYNYRQSVGRRYSPTYDEDSNSEDSEGRTYDNYNGSYAQDYANWSDDEIDDALEGDPDNYWNID